PCRKSTTTLAGRAMRRHANDVVVGHSPFPRLWRLRPSRSALRCRLAVMLCHGCARQSASSASARAWGQTIPSLRDSPLYTTSGQVRERDVVGVATLVQTSMLGSHSDLGQATAVGSRELAAAVVRTRRGRR